MQNKSILRLVWCRLTNLNKIQFICKFFYRMSQLDKIIIPYTDKGKFAVLNNFQKIIAQWRRLYTNCFVINVCDQCDVTKKCCYKYKTGCVSSFITCISFCGSVCLSVRIFCIFSKFSFSYETIRFQTSSMSNLLLSNVRQFFANIDLALQIWLVEATP